VTREQVLEIVARFRASRKPAAKEEPAEPDAKAA